MVPSLARLTAPSAGWTATVDGRTVRALFRSALVLLLCLFLLFIRCCRLGQLGDLGAQQLINRSVYTAHDVVHNRDCACCVVGSLPTSWTRPCEASLLTALCARTCNNNSNNNSRKTGNRPRHRCPLLLLQSLLNTLIRYRTRRTRRAHTRAWTHTATAG